MQLKEVQTKKGKAWEVVGYLGLQPNGKRKKVQKRGFTSRREASAWFNNEVTLFSNGQSQYNEKAPKTVFTVRELYEMWLETYQNTVEESTLAKVLRHFSLHILPRWGDTVVDQIKPVELQEYLNTMQAKILSYKKVVRYFNQLTKMAVKLDMIDVDPFIKVDMPRERKSKPKKRAMDAQEFKRFIEVLDGQYCQINKQAYTLLRLVAVTGMRTEEVLALQWKHINFDGGYITIEQALGRGLHGGTYIKATKSETSTRTIKVASDMIRKLAQWYNLSKNKEPDSFVFNNNSKALQVLRPNKWLHEVSDRYGVANGVSMHGLRHTWTTLALEQGATVKQVQTYLGHADASITLNIYAEITKKASEQTGEVLSNLIS
ncbi:site-specific integrase [Fructobacillus fructosus]|uniref:site-specific integrase n=1 Tax=Fructobacillus fructosus TaxID=1631 RepID=UPI0016588F3D|nr:site-specific integrase [Fructobacillus fructosus]MBC9118628.1 tyrosine-type recombinase/integrase [Fructobacillus fructosus]MBD9365291.1 tyrosine-type recombinase/integrase [Leuconostoc mesenteroides]